LSTLKESFSNVDYLIINEMSMVGWKLIGQVQSRLRHA